MTEAVLSTTEPNHTIQCVVCGQTPTVDILTPGEPIHHTERAGRAASAKRPAPILTSGKA